MRNESIVMKAPECSDTDCTNGEPLDVQGVTGAMSPNGRVVHVVTCYQCAECGQTVLVTRQVEV